MKKNEWKKTEMYKHLQKVCIDAGLDKSVLPEFIAFAIRSHEIYLIAKMDNWSLNEWKKQNQKAIEKKKFHMTKYVGYARNTIKKMLTELKLI